MGKSMLRTRCFPCCLFVVAIACLLPARIIAQGRPMTFEDLMRMRRVADPNVSPDNRWVLFTVTDVELQRNTRTPHLWIVPLNGGKERAITAAVAGEHGGRFSPDGTKILFSSARDGEEQIYIASFDSANGSVGDTKQLTHIPTGAQGAIWSPDGNTILFTSFVYPDCTGTEAQAETCNSEKLASKEHSPLKAQIFTHLLFRHWDTYTGERRRHLFIISENGGEARDLTPGVDQDIPPFSLGQPQGYAFSPDGKEIAFEWNTDADQALSTNKDIFTLSLSDANAQPVRISASPGGDFTPRYSPDGRYESDRFRLMLYDRQDKQLHELLPGFDRWVDDLAWSRDSKAIYFLSGVAGEEPVFRVDVDGGDLSQLTRKGTYDELRPSADGKSLVLTRSTIREPAEIYLLRLGKITSSTRLRNISHPRKRSGPTPISGRETPLEQYQLTHLNSGLLSQLALPEMEEFWFYGAQRTLIEGFLLTPPSFDPQQKYPVKFLIHGGPEGDWSDSWSYRWNAELFAAGGYVVVMINPRGSTGYGQSFIDAVNGDWGGKPYIDLMLGLDHAEKKYPFIDSTRECALGGSYGGYMTNWILGHTDRFRCIVTHDGVFDTESAYGSTDELWFPEWEFRGTPWNAAGTRHENSLYRRWSPMLFAARFKTPTLVIHGQLDYRLDLSQGLSLFTTLKRMGVPSEMLYFPDEGHWVLKPLNSRLWYKTVNGWCDQWTGTGNPRSPLP
jgi:dipeptidyl aminopeptidase/acylaminoacyl peptidase